MENKKFWQTVLAVAAGFLSVSVLAFFGRLWLVNQAMTEMQRNIMETSNRLNEAARRQAEKARLEQEERVRGAQEAELQKRQEKAAGERAGLEAALATEHEAQAKQAAWKKYYLRPAHCDAAEGRAFVECGNHYILAKRKFEELYAAGKL